MLRFIKGFLIALWLIFFVQVTFALPFNIFPKAGTNLPSSVIAGQTVTAYYTVQNKTGSTRINNFVKYLPPNVTQVIAGGTYGDTCGATFTLTAFGMAGDSCTLQLTVSGPVDAQDPNLHHHLFVCMPGGISCAGTRFPLNVSSSSLLSITVTPANPTVPNGATQQFTATGHYSGGETQDITSSVSWSSSNTGVATIDSAGLATVVASSGTTTITATSGSVSGSTTLTADNVALVSIAVTPANPTVPNGTTQQFTATGNYSDGSTQNLTATATWTSGTPAVATITPGPGGGLATAVASAGTSLITATSGAISGDTTLTAAAPVLVSIAITPTSATLIGGKTQQYTATGTYSDSSTSDITTTVTWNSSNTNVATIVAGPSVSGGLATAVGTGSSSITATLSAITSNTATLTVNTYIYVANNGNSTTSQCLRNSNGTLSGCGTTGSGFSSPDGAAVDPTTTFGYITNTDANTINYCAINSSTGAFTSCGSTASITNPTGIAFNPAGTFIYISTPGGVGAGVVTKCTVNGNGTLSPCATAASGAGFDFISDLNVNPSNTFFYSTNAGGSTITYCAVNPVNGNLSSCGTAVSGLTRPFSIAFNPAGTIAYSVSDTLNLAYYCTVNGNGTLSSCTTTGSAFNGPHQIRINKTNTFAYITNLTGSSVTYCAVNSSTGALSNCATTGSTFNGPRGLAIP